MINNLPAGDMGSIPRSGGSPGEGNAIHSSILIWKIPWTEEPGKLQSMGCKELDIVTKQQQHYCTNTVCRKEA